MAQQRAIAMGISSNSLMTNMMLGGFAKPSSDNDNHESSPARVSAFLNAGNLNVSSPSQSTSLAQALLAHLQQQRAQ